MRATCSLYATLVLASCANGAAPAAPGPLASSSASPATSAAPTTTPEGASKKTLTAADCPRVGDPVAPAGDPSVGKARHDEIVATFQKHRDKFRCCYDTARQQNKALKGSYNVEVVLKSDGSIKQVMPQKATSEIQDQGMDDCVYSVVGALRFSPNAEGKETTIPYQFGFTPGGGR